ncbi:MAG: DNA recombination protein RmuC [Sedimentisphaerales bacterium]|nr:DNA recombination protein RmuC [Sedimentisphaerales bacterium]
METILLVIAVVLLVLLLILVFSLASGTREKLAQQASSVASLQQQLEAVRTASDGARNVLQDSLQKGHATLTQSLQSTSETLNKLHNQIGQVITASTQMQKVGDEVKRLQDILASPKLRGGMGEWSLNNLLSQTLPAQSYQLQYTFKDGQKVDALVNLADYAVPIDSKFPLSSFEPLLKADSDDAKIKLRRQFHSDVIKHIDKIASSYIRPSEGTVDFAMMFIPAENVYYEAIVQYPDDAKNILQYSLDKKVVPVSPNLLYAYLMTVAMGLHGLLIEKQAAEIRQNLKTLNNSLADFIATWDVLGKHLHNAYSQYDDGQKKLDRFAFNLDHIQKEDVKND